MQTDFQQKQIPASRAGFTLIELLVVISIIGLLIGLLLPAVQAAREAARRLQCKNQLKQIGLAAQLHVDSHRHLPTGGWGNGWVGDPNHGFGQPQSGGWIFNILPFIEQANLRQLGEGLPPDPRRLALTDMLGRPVGNFNCPSRRGAELFPYLAPEPLFNANRPESAAKSDYAINAGDMRIDSGRGPASRLSAHLQSYVWPPLTTFTGVSFVRSRVRLADVTDGLTNTYLVGEKYVSMSDPTGHGGDDQTMLMGDDADVRRWGDGPPLPDSQRVNNRWAFGSRHSAVCQFVMVDGSVHSISYGIDPQVHHWLSNRRDGQVASVPQ